LAALLNLGAGSAHEDLLLKVTPPRVPRQLVLRPRLLSHADAFRDVQSVLLQAPAGFGKTSLQAQWRLEHLARGSCVAWLSAQPQDDPRRLAQGLAMAVRVGAGRPNFCQGLLESTRSRGLEGISIWLTELAQAAIDLVLIVDDADCLPEPSLQALAYVLHNAPPNLRTVVAGRAERALEVGELVDYGRCSTIGPTALRFRLDETLQLVRMRFGKRVDADTAARLQELTEGWPLGLQLVLSTMGSGSEVCTEWSAMSAHGGELRRHLVDLMLARLDPADTAFLTRLAALDQLHPDLCCAVEGRDDARERLERLTRVAPLFVGGEHSEWSRIHKLAREALHERFQQLAPKVQAQVHGRAALWLQRHDLLEDAAWHAFKSGQHELAYDLAEQSLYDALMKRGRRTAVLEWAPLVPLAELERRPRLLLAIAWALAVGERHEQAARMVDRLLLQPGVSDALRFECALILGAAALFADRPDCFAALHDPWAETLPEVEPCLQHVHANRCAYRALLDGEPALARMRRQTAPRLESANGSEHLEHWGHFIVGLSYLIEGQALLAESLLQPVLASAEAESGRRGSFACMLAALLATALWECNRSAEAASLLADRLDVLESSGVPDAVLLAYRTLARIAISEGAEHRAIELIEGLEAVGVSRKLPRLVIASLCELVYLHARRYRAQTCRQLCARIDALVVEASQSHERLWQRSVALMVEQAHVYAAIAAQDWHAAFEPLDRADALCKDLKVGRARIEILGLRAFVLHRCGEDARAHLQEAVDLAQAYGLRRVICDAHPDLAALVGCDRARPLQVVPQSPAQMPEPAREQTRIQPQPVPMIVPGAGALTLKEREVLGLLAHNLSNKEIGRAMQTGETTIKWHVKNLFNKLDVGSRKEVVRRARILGMLPPAN
jgi:LuxR family maltose regulon positive regulatory protein